MARRFALFIAFALSLALPACADTAIRLANGSPLAVSGGSSLTMVRSPLAFDVSRDLALADNVINLTPASYASWTAFLAANPTLTGKVVILGAGDYTSWGMLSLDSGEGDGTPSRRIVFKCAVRDSAIVRAIDLSGASHYLFHRLKIDDSAISLSHASHVSGGQDVIFDEITIIDPDQNGVRLRDCTSCGVQFSLLKRVNERSSGDRIALNTRNFAADVVDARFVGNTVLNFSDACQLTGAGANPETLFQRSCIVAHNLFGIDDSYYASLSPTDLIENALDVKIAGETAEEPLLVYANYIWNWRPHGSGGAGEAIVLQGYAKHAVVARNTIDDCETGYRNEQWPDPPTGYGARFDTLIFNTFKGITNTASLTNSGSCIAAYCPATIVSNAFVSSDKAHKTAAQSGANSYATNTYQGVTDSVER